MLRRALPPIFLASICLAQTVRLGVDMHLDTMQRVMMERVDLGTRLPDGEADLVRMREGGVNVPFLALWVPTYYRGAEAVRRTLDLRDAAQRLFDTRPGQIELARDAADIERIARAGKIAAVLTVEGGHQIDNDLAVLRMYYRLGIRAMTLTHFRNTDWADASTDQPRHNGLTEFGKQVVREMNRLGMLVDLSHVSDKTFSDALAVSTKPVIVSHSSCRAPSNIPRNVTDDMLRALAANGGVIGINLDSGFLNQRGAERMMALISKMAKEEPQLAAAALDAYYAREYREDAARERRHEATIEDAVAQIDHAVGVAGIDHVGLGSDFDGGIDPPKGLEDISKYPVLPAALKRKGYSDGDVAKIMGGNSWRVIRAVLTVETPREARP